MSSVSDAAASLQLVQWYEDLRDQATGHIPAATPRGLSLLLHAGLPAWMAACPPVTPGPAPTPAAPTAAPTPTRGLADQSVELVGVLTEMALGGLRRCSA